MISIVCVYNDEIILDDYLKKSLQNQIGSYEMIAVDNIKGTFKSAAEALNYGGKQAKGKYIMFAHQDVSFSSSSWIQETENWLDLISNLGIAGVAGMSEIGKSNKERGRNIVRHGELQEIWSWGNQIQRPEIVQTLDECLVLIPTNIFRLLQFDEKVCDDWHLYVVDYCLSIKKMGLEAYTIPMLIYHLSKGTKKKKYSIAYLISPFPKGYYRTLRKVIEKHRVNYNWIYTTCGEWNTSYPIFVQKFCKIAKDGLSILKTIFQ